MPIQGNQNKQMGKVFPKAPKDIFIEKSEKYYFIKTAREER